MDATETCSNCGAPLSPDLSWCGRCFAPVVREDPAPPSDTSMWIRTQRRERVTFEGATFSRWKAGPTSLGGFGRIVLTVLVLVGVVIGYPLARGGMVASVGFDVPGKAFMVSYAVVAGAGALYLIVRIWRRARVA
jgi:hypothetical protein